MIYEYFCEECQEVTSIEKSMKDDIPASVECPKCHKQAHRLYKNLTINIPPHMRAVSDINDGGYADYDHLKSTFSHAKRPSGKDKIFY